jgi:UDP-N-acetylglucosamine--N-acetylmuramyl-(pentapeptide) pyrophosphoryl-undecaprenol N-acetylglucosamine transferase
VNDKKTYRIILSGGGTGGHIYPAIAVADKAKELYPGTEILFVGANGKMEMEKVPQAGYSIVGLPVAGLHRKITLRNLEFPFRLAASISKAGKIISDFKPDAVAGFGGYASGPVLWVASGKKIPSVIQEQNSYAGITNKLLSKRVNRICVAYEGMEKYFPSNKVLFTGNPVRDNLFGLEKMRKNAIEHFGFKNDQKILLVLGGSLGARTLNQSIFPALGKFRERGIQLIWQVGSIYMTEYMQKLKGHDLSGIRAMDFIREMDMAYAAADLVVCRAGAITVSELCAAAKPAVLVPSPNVAEDHQSKNAHALAARKAAVIVSDLDAPAKLPDTCIDLIGNQAELKILSNNISVLARRNAAVDILKTITGLLN